MGKQRLRFGIHDGAGSRAATWNLWTSTGTGKSDVYLACREMYGSLKVSLHESGQWQIAYSQLFFDENVKGVIPKFEDRYLEKWLRPSDFAPGHTLALRIVTPRSAVRTPANECRFKGVAWLPNAPENNATEIDILITKPRTQVNGWPGKQPMGTSFIGSLPLDNGETVWAVYWFHVFDISSLPKGTGWFFKGKSEKDLKDLKEENLSLLAFGTEPDGSRVLYDCAVQILDNRIAGPLL